MSFPLPFSGLISLLKKDTRSEAKSKRVAQREVDKYSAAQGNPYLVSFPRTGSHWLRMLSELYFERPTLVRPFHYADSNDYLYLHHHDVDLKLQRENVIYLYREPVATIYSELNYHNADLNSEDIIRQTTDLYARHLDKWLSLETFTKHKTVLNYEKLQSDLPSEFKKLTDHLGLPLDPIRLVNVSAQTTKENVRSKTVLHDKKVVNEKTDYADQRSVFAKKHGTMIWDVTLDTRPHLNSFFTR